MRERGLKSRQCWRGLSVPHGRSREGAWIEISTARLQVALVIVAPVRERGLKYPRLVRGCHKITVAPVRERGLKYCTLVHITA